MQSSNLSIIKIITFGFLLQLSFIAPGVWANTDSNFTKTPSTDTPNTNIQSNNIPSTNTSNTVTTGSNTVNTVAPSSNTANAVTPNLNTANSNMPSTNTPDTSTPNTNINLPNIKLPTPSASTIIPKAPSLAAKSYLLIDYLSDYVIAEQNVDQRVEPASLTKMMTVYVADHALRSKRINLSDKVKISERAWKATGSRMFLEVNSEAEVQDLLKGIIIQSGNDASIALAEHIAGTEESFAELMNYCAQQLGMKNTHFTNATGLPDPNHYTTARDMAILAKAIVRDFPESYSLYSQKEFTYKDIKQTNRNRLLWQHNWVDGIKTGHTETAGFCLVASGEQEGMRLIAVLMGAKDDSVRTNETNQLLTYGFRFYETRKLYPKSSAIKKARVWKAKDNQIDAGLQNDLYITLGKGQFDRLTSNINLDKHIQAPLEAGATLGTLQVKLDDKTIAERPMITLQKVEEANIFHRTLDSIRLGARSLMEKVGLSDDKNE